PELPRQVGALGLQREPATDAIHVALQVLVLRQRRGAEQARRHVLADLDLLGLADVAGRLDDVLRRIDQLVDVELELRLRRRGDEEEQREQNSHFGYSMRCAFSLPLSAKRLEPS